MLGASNIYEIASSLARGSRAADRAPAPRSLPGQRLRGGVRHQLDLLLPGGRRAELHHRYLVRRRQDGHGRNRDDHPAHRRDLQAERVRGGYGVARRLIEDRLNYHSPKFSPDGRLIALDNTGSDGRDVWVLDREQQQLSRSTFDRDGHDPVWSRDGRTILYLSQKSGQLSVYRVRPGGGGKPDSVFSHRSNGYTGIPLGAGDTLLSVGTDLNGRSGLDVALIHTGPPGRLEPLFASPFDEGWAAPSPDGKWLAFTSDESGRQEVYVHPMSQDGLKVKVSIDGGSEPVWARNGRELFYRRPTGGAAHLVVAELQLAPEARVLKRTTLFDASEYEPAQPHPNFDVAPDGQSFVMLRSPATHIVVIQNVQELVRRAQGARTQAPR